VVPLEPLDDLNAARDAAHSIAAALNEGRISSPINVRVLHEPREDPVGIRRRWVWAGIWAGALATGAAWEITHHWKFIDEYQTGGDEVVGESFQLSRVLRTAFPDLHAEIIEQCANGDCVVTRPIRMR
jgi:hypothetical protein